MDVKALVTMSAATLRRGDRTLWSDLDVAVQAGEFIAVLGPNGAGKTSLLKVLLGQLPLTRGQVSVLGQAPGEANRQIGYIPQQKAFDPLLSVRGVDLVELGLNGDHFGLWHNHKAAARLVAKAIGQVQATDYAAMPIGLLSGGEQQRLRVAQAIVAQPRLLLCDEPLLSLDLASQNTITGLLNDYRTGHDAAIIFVTHEINPILPWVDKVLYLANGRWVIDKPEHVLQSKTLTDLYDTPVEVLKLHGRLIVVGADDENLASPGAHHEEHR
jgi:zinc/manganese transport system ATP-binding protein